MNSSLWIVVIVAVVLGCGLVAVLESGREAAGRDRRSESTQAELERTSRELRHAREEIRRLTARLEAQKTTARRERVASEPTSPKGDVEAARTASLGPAPIFSAVVECLQNGDLTRAIQMLAASLGSGELTKLQLMNFAVAHPELISAGINDHDLDDQFRETLIDSLSSAADPIGVLRDVDLRGEPSPRFSAGMAAMVRSIVDADAKADSRVFAQIQALLDGNPMRGEKINLYPTLAQLGRRGDVQARAAAEKFVSGSGSMFAEGVRVLLDPPRFDDQGRPLRGAVIFSSQFNKGEWASRPKTLALGDIVLSIGDVSVAKRSDFQNAVSRYRGRSRDEDLVKVTVYARRADGSGIYELQNREMDPGDFRLMYGVYSVR